jgi:hypothetical protein
LSGRILNFLNFNPFNLKLLRGSKMALAFFGKVFFLAMGIGAASESGALQLGKHRGAAIIGQPLNIGIQATVDSPEELAVGCVDAEVFYADNRVEKSRVRVSSEKSGIGADALIRVRTTVPIDEPVVTIYLRTGCVQKVEKRYVVLADMLSESAAATGGALPSVPAQMRPSNTGPQIDSSGSVKSALDVGREARRLERAEQRADKKNQAAAAKQARNAQASNLPGSSSRATVEAAVLPEAATGDKKAATAMPKVATPEKSKGRLKLEPIELLAERDPTLKPSTELRTAPTNDPAQRSAAAALWRAIAAQPGDILGDSQKLKSLEAAVSGLQVQMKKNEHDMKALGGDIEKAQTEKYANPLVYGLSFLLFLAAVGLAVILRKRAAGADSQASVQPWWRKGSGQQVGWADSGLDVKSSLSRDASSFNSGHTRSSDSDAAPSLSYLDLDLSDALGNSARESVNIRRGESSLLASVAGARGKKVADEPTVNLRADFAQSMTFSARAVKAEELFDVQQQADFFVSLGQKDQAIEVLRSHIEESEETSALVYLDLLKLYHQLNEKLEFEAFRQEFNAKFNAEMPEFDYYSAAATGDGLQAYSLAMSRIVALWPSAKVLTVIEESMFRQPDSQTATFDLEAYRELLLLYAMIKDILHAQSIGKGPTLLATPPRTGKNMPFNFGRDTLPQAGIAHDRASHFPATAVVPLTATAATEPPNADLDVDVDLSALGKLQSATAALSTMQPQGEFEGKGSASPARQGTETKADLLIPENSIDFDQPASAELTTKKSIDRPPRNTG